MVFSVRTLPEDGRITGGNTVVQLLTFIKEFDLIREDAYGPLTH